LCAYKKYGGYIKKISLKLHQVCWNCFFWKQCNLAY